jgi:hypothetical protein
MANESREEFRLSQLEKRFDEMEKRVDRGEDRMTVFEVKESGREKKANRAVNAVVTLCITLAGVLAAAFFTGGHP